ncbi:MAG: trypsin-like serine protease [Renibacterium salmoninarum]|nr:trypsin-like serine protease [Renibacterium salmoninarum]
MKLVRLAAALGAAAALTLSGAAVSTAAPAPEATPAASTPSPRIIGGNAADISQAPFAALQLVNGQANCSGSQISATWVLTAKHCIEKQSVSSMSVQLGAAKIGQGTTIKAKRALGWSGGDVALIELVSPYQNTYSKLGASTPAANTPGDIFGWGAINTAPTYPDYLKTAKVTVVGTNNSNWPGPSIVEKGDNGQALWGDSGGPLIVNGKQVGVCSGPLQGSPGTISGTVMYASTVAAASWIKSTSGVSAS